MFSILYDSTATDYFSLPIVLFYKKKYIVFFQPFKNVK